MAKKRWHAGRRAKGSPPPPDPKAKIAARQKRKAPLKPGHRKRANINFTPKIGEKICKLISSGMTLSHVCKIAGMPHIDTVWDWRQVHLDFDKAYMKARVALMEHWADQIVDISDNTVGDMKTIVGANGKEKTIPNFDNVARDRLKIDTRKWLMGKLSPFYGDEATLRLKGSKEEPIIITEKLDLSWMTEEEQDQFSEFIATIVSRRTAESRARAEGAAEAEGGAEPS